MSGCIREVSRTVALNRPQSTSWSYQARRRCIRIHEIVRNWLRESQAALKRSHAKELSQWAKERLEDLTSSVSANHIAGDLGCRPAALNRCFARDNSMTMREYRRRAQTAAAIKLLSATDLKVEAIGREVGCRSRKNVYEALRVFGGKTPQAIREMSSDAVADLLRIVTCERTEAA